LIKSARFGKYLLIQLKRNINLSHQIQLETITLTPEAAKTINDLLLNKNLHGYALRVYISGGGCSGYQYKLGLEGNIHDQDIILESNGVKVVVDEYSIEYLRGATIDYVKTSAGSGFSIDSPISLPSCNCNNSPEINSCSGCA
jgi:iron-sulfur cluster assembly protein